MIFPNIFDKFHLIHIFLFFYLFIKYYLTLPSTPSTSNDKYCRSAPLRFALLLGFNFSFIIYLGVDMSYAPLCQFSSKLSSKSLQYCLGGPKDPLFLGGFLFETLILPMSLLGSLLSQEKKNFSNWLRTF